MENVQNNNGTNGNLNTNEGSNHGGNDGQTSLAGLLFGGEGDAGKEKDPEQSAEASAGTSPDGTENGTGTGTDDGTETEGDSQPGAGENGEVTDPNAAEVWEYDGKEYNAEQMAAALKDHDTYQRFNQSIAPLVDGIRQYGETASALKIAAQTECEKTITELKRRLASGQLDSREYQQNHQALQQAEQRMQILDNAVKQEQEARNQALNQVRAQNARQVATNLVRSGWTREQIVEAESIAKTVFKSGESYGDSITVELMEVFKDAAAQRKARTTAENKLREAGKKAVQVTHKPVTTQKIEKKKDKSFGSLVWGE